MRYFTKKRRRHIINTRAQRVRRRRLVMLCDDGRKGGERGWVKRYPAMRIGEWLNYVGTRALAVGTSGAEVAHKRRRDITLGVEWPKPALVICTWPISWRSWGAKLRVSDGVATHEFQPCFGFCRVYLCFHPCIIGSRSRIITISRTTG